MSSGSNAGEAMAGQNLLRLDRGSGAAETSASPEQGAGDGVVRVMEVPRVLAAVCNEQDDSTEFEWTSQNLDVVVPQQGAVAVYSNPMGVVVIRQEKDWNDEGDHFVFVHPTHIDALVERLMVYKAQAERTIAERRHEDLREKGVLK